MTPTQRTLAFMREQGRLCAIVEKYNAFVGPNGIRQDCFGWMDILAIDPVDGIVGVQSCGQNWAEHVAKLIQERNEALAEWVKHAKAELWGWRKVKLHRGGKALRWAPRVGDIMCGEGGKIEIVERKGM